MLHLYELNGKWNKPNHKTTLYQEAYVSTADNLFFSHYLNFRKPHSFNICHKEDE